MTVFVHEHGLCESATVGDGTRIWAFAHVLPGARIGADCNICDHVFVENDVVVGDRVTVKCGVQLWDGIRLADDVFVGPNATFTNDPFPRSKVYPASFPETTVGPGASLGANATILPGPPIGRDAMVGAGAVVTKDVPPHAIVVGNPARIVGYVDAQSRARRRSRRRAAPASTAREPRARGRADPHDARRRSARRSRGGQLRRRPAVRAEPVLHGLRRSVGRRPRSACAPRLRAAARVRAGQRPRRRGRRRAPPGVPARPAGLRAARACR